MRTVIQIINTELWSVATTECRHVSMTRHHHHHHLTTQQSPRQGINTLGKVGLNTTSQPAIHTYNQPGGGGGGRGGAAAEGGGAVAVGSYLLFHGSLFITFEIIGYYRLSVIIDVFLVSTWSVFVVMLC